MTEGAVEQALGANHREGSMTKAEARSAPGTRPWRRRPVLGWAARYVTLIALVIAWQVLVTAGLVSEDALPAPLDVLQALWRWGAGGQLLDDVGASLLRVAWGFALAAAAGTLLGLTLAISPAMSRQITPLVEVLRPVPPIAWIPLAILWFGISTGAALFIVFLGAFFPVFTGTFLGVTSVDPDYYNTARSLGLRGWLLVRHILCPAALPSIFLGLRTGLGVGWMSLVAAELVGAQSGLGYSIQINRLLLNTDSVIAGMLMIGMLGLLMNRLLLALARRLMPWHRTLEAVDRNPRRGRAPGA